MPLKEENKQKFFCAIGLVSRPEFNSRSSFTKRLKNGIDVSLLNTQHYKVGIKDKWSSLRKGTAPFSTPLCCSYWKGSLRVALDNGQLTYKKYYFKD